MAGEPSAKSTNGRLEALATPVAMKPNLILALLITQAGLLAQVDWAQASPPTSPPARCRHVMHHDIQRGVTVMFGGNGAQTGSFALLNDTWEFDGTTWTQVSTATSPPARQYSAMAYDLFNGKLLMFGGMGWNGQSFTTLNDLWEFDGVDWTQITTATSPPTRARHGLAFDTFSGLLVLFGGQQIQGGSGNLLGDMWSFDGTTWTQAQLPMMPPARMDHGMVGQINGEVVLFGGTDGTSVLGDTWTLGTFGWNLQAPPMSAPAQVASSMTFDANRERCVLWDGNGAVHEWEFYTWLNRTTASTPSNRVDVATAFDWQNGNVVMFGGCDATTLARLSDTWTYAPLSPATATPFGTACGPAPTAPILFADNSTAPWIGGSLGVGVVNAPPNSMVFIAMGVSTVAWNGQTLPMSLDQYGMTGCSLFIAPEFVVTAFAPFGAGIIGFPVPHDPTLIGTSLYAQGASPAPGANPASLLTTEAVHFVVGSK